MTAKVRVTSQNTVSVSCPRCRKGRVIDAHRLKGYRDVGIKCPCGNAWRVEVDYRHDYRKKTDLKGSYRCYSEDNKFGNPGFMKVVDLSRKGLRMEIRNFPRGLDVGDRLKIEFKLDDANKSSVTREVVVKNIHPPYVGAMFHRPPVEDNIIGFYLFR